MAVKQSLAALSALVTLAGCSQPSTPPAPANSSLDAVVEDDAHRQIDTHLRTHLLYWREEGELTDYVVPFVSGDFGKVGAAVVSDNQEGCVTAQLMANGIALGTQFLVDYGTFQYCRTTSRSPLVITELHSEREKLQP